MRNVSDCGSMFVVNRAPSRGDAHETTMSCCMCEPTETAQSVGDDPHVVVTRLKEHQTQTSPQCCVIRCVGGLQSPAHRCSHKDAGRSERKTEILVNVTKITPEHQTCVHNTELSKTTLFKTIRKDTRYYDTSHQSSRDVLLIQPESTHPPGTAQGPHMQLHSGPSSWRRLSLSRAVTKVHAIHLFRKQKKFHSDLDV